MCTLTSQCARLVDVGTEGVWPASAGVLMTKAELERASALCEAAGSWLVMDDTYEHFVYDGQQHHCIAGPNIIHIFSFSKVRNPCLFACRSRLHLLSFCSLKLHAQSTGLHRKPGLQLS